MMPEPGRCVEGLPSTRPGSFSLLLLIQSMDRVALQKKLCAEHNTAHVPNSADLKVGISLSVKGKSRPIHGLRHNPEGDTTGWYIWAGDYSTADDFFLPVHLSHIDEWTIHVQKYLGLGPGWRFLISPEDNYEDVWFDETLLDIPSPGGSAPCPPEVRGIG